MKLATALLVALLPLSLAAEDVPKPAPAGTSQVTLALGEYETLRNANERPSATVIDTIRLAGTFRGRDLTMTFSGRAVGTRPATNVIESANDVTISGCTGAAILTRTGKGAYALIPTADAFEMKCDVRISGSDRLQLHVPPHVLAVASSVADGELVTGDEDDNGGRQYSLVRQVTGSGERLAATATGRYRITLLPDATRFRYVVDVHNPNRSTTALQLAFASNEHLQEIDSAAPYEVEASRYTFTIPPGDSTITMTGELRGSSFRAPVEASLQYLVIESHPLIRPAVQTPAKRVSIAETGITPQFRGALAFETGAQQIAWQVTRLEAMRTTSYAANTAVHTFFVPLDGPVLGESLLEVRNEGAAELLLPARPEPTFVSLGDEPVLMTKNRDGRVSVPLSTGIQSVLVQHRQPFAQRLGIGYGRVVVPQLDVTSSKTMVRMRYPGEWIPIYQAFATRSVLWTPDPAMVLLFLAFAVWVERLLAWLGYGIRRRIVVALAAALAATAVFTFLLLLLLVCSALTFAWLMTRPMRTRVAAAVGIVAAGLVVLVAVNISNVSMRKYESSIEPSRSAGTDTAQTDTSMTSIDTAPPRQQEQVYQGLPAKFELPSGSRWDNFFQELLRVDREQSVRVLAISMAIVKWIGLLIAIAVAIVLLRDRRVLVDGYRDRTRPVPEV